VAAVAAAAPLALAAAGALAQPAADPAPAVSTPVPAPPQLRADQAELALKVLRDAESHGLLPRDYLPARLLAEDAHPGPEDQAALLQGLTRYAHDVHVGRLDPADFPRAWGLRPQPYDAAAALTQALAADRLGDWLDSLPPPYAGYVALRDGLARYREIADRGGWKAVPSGPSLSTGASGVRVADLRARLAVEDDQVALTGPFDAPLKQAVIRAQRRFGLEPDGVVGRSVLAALNQTPDQRIAQIIANLERWRWLPDQMPPTRLQVNSGAAIVTLFRDDRPVLSMKAVSGRPGDETPMLVAEVNSVVLNPPWNVPSSIASKELWPKERRDPGYFARNDFQVITNPDGSTRLQQRAGPKAALGRYKFDFENPYGVYLHDTPTQSTFERYARQQSHGCVRLEKPAELAEALLADDPKWTPEAIQAAVDDGDTLRVKLPERVPVYILYWTAFVGADGAMNFRSDPYKWDSLLLARIGAPAAEPKALAER
jgi:murein L,D-transpeptidase YcbB/YkuD